MSETETSNVSRRNFLKQLGFAAIGTALGASSLVNILQSKEKASQKDVEKIVHETLDNEVDLTEDIDSLPCYEVYKKANLTSAIAITGLFAATTGVILAGKKAWFDKDTVAMFNAAEWTRIATLKRINYKYKIDEKIDIMINKLKNEKKITNTDPKIVELEESKIAHHLWEEIHGMIESYVVSGIATAIVDYGTKIEVDTTDLLKIQEKPSPSKSKEELAHDSRESVANLFTGTFWLSGTLTNFVGSSVSQQAKSAIMHTYEAYVRTLYQEENPDATTKQLQQNVTDKFTKFSSYLTNMCFHLPSNAQGMFSPLLLPSGGIPNIFYFLQEQLKNPHALYIDYVSSGLQSLYQTYTGINQVLQYIWLPKLSHKEFLQKIEIQRKELIQEKWLDIRNTIKNKEDHNIHKLKKLFQDNGDSIASKEIQWLINDRPAVSLNVDDRWRHLKDLFTKSSSKIEDNANEEEGIATYHKLSAISTSISDTLKDKELTSLSSTNISELGNTIIHSIQWLVWEIDNLPDNQLTAFFMQHLQWLKTEQWWWTLLDSSKVYDTELLPNINIDSISDLNIKTFGDVFNRISANNKTDLANYAHFTNIQKWHEHFSHVAIESRDALFSQMPVVPSLNVSTNALIDYILQKLNIKNKFTALLISCLIAMCIINAKWVTPHADNVAAMLNNIAIIKSQVKKLYGEKWLNNKFALAILWSCAKQIGIVFWSSFKAGCPSNFFQTKHTVEYNTSWEPNITEVPLSMGETRFPKPVVAMNMRSMAINSALTAAWCYFMDTSK